MGSKGRMPPPNFRRPVPGPGLLHPDAFGPDVGLPPPGPFYFDMLPPPEVMEQKLNVQHAEMQGLATENERLAASLSALRQELAAAQQDHKRLKMHAETVAIDQEEQLRALLDRIARMETDLKTLEPIKMELQQAHAEAQGLVAAREELISQVQKLNQDLQRSHGDVQQIPALMSELEALRQEYQHFRATYDYERKLRIDHFESLQGMEKNYVSMSNEVEKLRAELKSGTIVDKSGSSVRDGNFGANTGHKDSDSLNQSSVAHNTRGEVYGAAQGRGPPGGTPQYGRGTAVHAPGRSAYDGRSASYDASNTLSYNNSNTFSYNASAGGTHEPYKGTGYEALKAPEYVASRTPSGSSVTAAAGAGHSGVAYGSNKDLSPSGAAQGTAQPVYGSAQQPAYGVRQQQLPGPTQQVGYSSPQQSAYRSPQQPVSQQPAYGLAQQPGYGYAQQPAYSLAQQTVYGSGQQPAYQEVQQLAHGYAQQPAYRVDQQPAHGSIQQQQPTYGSEQIPSRAGTGYEPPRGGNSSFR